MKLIFNSTLKASASLGFCLLASIISSNEKVYANTCESLFGDNPSSINDSCYITPSTYKIRVYEMGLCTSDPLEGTSIVNDNVVTDNTISESSCTATFQSSSGTLVDLGGNATQTLTGTNFRPPIGTYPHAYIKIKNTFGLKGTYQINNNTFYTSNDGSPVAEALHSEFDEDLMDFSNGKTCSGSPELAGAEVFTTGVTGTMKAVLAQVSSGNLGTYTADSSCGSSTHLFGSFQPTSPVIISNQTNGMEVNFSITGRGMTVFPDGSGGMSGFGGGPFSPSFSTF
tara:strand:- start:165 stop:1016 length:852 start_codon:yes stop_codon:yes gene_type:complete